LENGFIQAITDGVVRIEEPFPSLLLVPFRKPAKFLHVLAPLLETFLATYGGVGRRVEHLKDNLTLVKELAIGEHVTGEIQPQPSPCDGTPILRLVVAAMGLSPAISIKSRFGTR
jgi:hypothetical protein